VTFDNVMTLILSSANHGAHVIVTHGRMTFTKNSIYYNAP